MRTWLLALLLLTTAFIGCLGDDEDGSGTTPPIDDPAGNVSVAWPAKAVPFGNEHDHNDRADHQNLSTPNFQTVGYDPLETDYHGATSGDYLCGEVATEGDREIAVTHSFGTDVAFVVSDVSDPSNPRKIGEMALPYSHTYDAAVTPDGKYVVLAISGTDSGSDQEPGTGPTLPDPGEHQLRMEWTDGCGGQQNETEQVPYQSGVLLVDISNPSDPEIADYLAQPVLGPHSIFATMIDGTYRLLASTTNLAHTASYFSFLTIEEGLPTGPRLVETDVYQAQYEQDAAAGSLPALTNGHVDGWIAPHPETGETIAYLANWNGGLHVVLVDEMGQAQRLAVWNDYDPDAGAGMTGQIHGALPMDELWDGVHYTFVGQEVVGRPAERPTGQVLMVDTTDPANPEPVARWTLPTDVEFDGSLHFSTHYFAVVDRTLFVSLYHGGVWAVDTTERINGTELATEGVFVPDRAPPNPPPEHLNIFRWTPIVLDVLSLPNGDLVVFDGTSGIYTVRFDPGVDVPTPDPWTQDGGLAG